MTTLTCRGCGTTVTESFADLGLSPLSNAYVHADQLAAGELFHPLHAMVCPACFLVQLGEFESPAAIFSDYAYFSSYSDSWLAHARDYAAAATARYGLGAGSQVIEIASNDGYLLQYFKALGVPVLGVEPAANVAAAARARGIPTRVEFFAPDTAAALRREHPGADLLVANNVLAHVPRLKDFVAAMAQVLKPRGVITIEFPHLLRLIQQAQFDTIYHEHFSYFSLASAEHVLARAGLAVFDVEELATHGGSLRLHVQHRASGTHTDGPGLAAVRAAEAAAGLHELATYRGFAARVQQVKRSLLRFLIDAREDGKTVLGYGAPAKATTLLNYCGVRSDLLAFTVDRSPHKQGCYLPGVRIPILAPEALLAARPDYVLILPWNLREEITTQLAAVRAWGGRFVVPVPELAVLP